MIEKAILEDMYWAKQWSSSSIAQKVGVHNRTVRKWLERYEIPRKTISQAITKYPKTDFGDDLSLKSYILGLRAGDVHAKRIHKIIRVQTTTTHPAQVEMMERTFGNFSHVGKHLFFNKFFGISEWFVYCDLNESFSFILEKPNHIPDWIMKNDENFYNFVAGYSDSEGSWKLLKSHENDVRLVFQLSSQDKEILRQIVDGLNRRGYAAHLYLDVKAGTKKNNRDLYRLMLYKHKDVIKLATALLPLSKHQEKIDKIHLILGSAGKKWNEIENQVIELRNKIRGSRLQKADSISKN